MQQITYLESFKLVYVTMFKYFTSKATNFQVSFRCKCNCKKCSISNFALKLCWRFQISWFRKALSEQVKLIYQSWKKTSFAVLLEFSCILKFLGNFFETFSFCFVTDLDFWNEEKTWIFHFTFSWCGGTVKTELVLFRWQPYKEQLVF